MKIAHLSIKNILGVTELELSPKGFTEISGANGTGKTSVLEAIKSALETGHDATLLRQGATEGETVLVLDDGTEISKRVTAGGSTTSVKRDGKKITRPAEAIKALTDMLSVNPVDFLNAPKKDRVRVLLEAMPIEVDAKHLSALAGVPVKAQPGVHALHVIGQVHTQIYDARTGTNRALKEKAATIKQLEAAVPPLPAGVAGDEEELQAQVTAADTARDGTLQRINAKLQGLRTDSATAIENLRTEAQRKIDEIKAQLDTDIEANRAALAEQEARAAAAATTARTKHTDTVQPLQDQLRVIRSDREASGRRAQTLDTIAALQTELGTLQAEADQQTQALADIEAYKTELLAGLPIPGVEVVDGEIYRNGVQFDRLNTAQKVDIAVQLAVLRAADLGIVCVDRIECMDTAFLEEFRARALESGLQMFVTRVADSEFGIETND